MTMKVVRIVCVLTACVLGLVVVDGAWAETTTFTATTGDWNVEANWDNGVPLDGDTAIINTGKTCNLSSTSALLDRLEVKSTANLNVKTSGVVQLNSGALASTVSGTVTLETSTSQIAVLVSLTINGSGKIVGADNGAQIILSDQKTLTSQTTIEGKLKITRVTGVSGTKFINQGTVHANVAGTLWIDSNDVDDSSAGLWKVSTSTTAILRFDPVTSDQPGTAPRFLDGDFDVFSGKLKVDFPGLDTAGTLIWTGGTIDCSTVAGVETGGKARFTGS